MRVDILENTDKFAVVQFGGGIGFSMSHKRRERCFFVQGDDAVAFNKSYRDLMQAYGTDGSVYYGMTKNGVLASLFDMYDHIAENSDLTPSQFVEQIEAKLTN